MADESTRVDQWIYTVLSADVTLAGIVSTRIYADLAPPGSARPAVVFHNQSGVDVIGATESSRIMLDGLWTVLGVAESTTWVGDLQDIADRVDALLHASAGGTADSATIFTSHRIRPLRFVEERNGRQFRRLGGLYRVYAQR